MKVRVLTLLAISTLAPLCLARADSSTNPVPVQAKPSTAKPVKLIDLKYCPMTLESVEGGPKDTAIVDNYRVHFCCDGCPSAFAKLSLAEKREKVAEILKKEAADKKTG